MLVDTRGSNSNPLNADRIAELKAAGVPIRNRTSPDIMHWKVMLFDGQNIIEFSAANYSAVAFVPDPRYVNYIDDNDLLHRPNVHRRSRARSNCSVVRTLPQHASRVVKG